MHANIKNNSNEFLANLLGWIYIFAFIFMLGCYIYGLSGISDKKSFEHGQRHLVEIAPMRGAIDKKSFKHDEGRLTGIAWIRCAIEKYIAMKLPGLKPGEFHLSLQNRYVALYLGKEFSNTHTRTIFCFF